MNLFNSFTVTNQKILFRNTNAVSTTAERVNSAPQTMQWAVRSRTKPGRGGSGADPAGSGNFIYIDPNLRRNPPGGGGNKFYKVS